MKKMERLIDVLMMTASIACLFVAGMIGIDRAGASIELTPAAVEVIHRLPKCHRCHTVLDCPRCGQANFAPAIDQSEVAP